MIAKSQGIIREVKVQLILPTIQNLVISKPESNQYPYSVLHYIQVKYRYDINFLTQCRVQQLLHKNS